MTATELTELTGLAAAIAAEHAAIYAYGPIGVWLRGAEADAARECEATHRSRRDALALTLADRSEVAPVAEAVYELPFPVQDRADARRLAILIEERVAAVWRAVLAQVAAEDRPDALAALVDTAVWVTRWKLAAGETPVTTPFPGAP